MKRVAAIDIGTNSTRLLVAGFSGAGEIMPLYSDLKTTRLGEGIEGGILLPGPALRTIEAVQEMLGRAKSEGASVVVAAGTSAVRDAVNREWFIDEMYHRTGLMIRVLDGREEAYFSYLGVAAGFGGLGNAVIVDIGGGSTEFTWEEEGETVCRSINVGAVRMTEGGHDDPKILEIMGKVLDEVRRVSPERLIGVGGTATTLAAVDMGLEVYDRTLVHGYRLAAQSVCALLKKLYAAGSEGRKKIPGLQPARADIIVAGVRILLLLMEFLRFDEITVSEADLLYGLALEAEKMCR